MEKVQQHKGIGSGFVTRFVILNVLIQVLPDKVMLTKLMAGFKESSDQ